MGFNPVLSIGMALIHGKPCGPRATPCRAIPGFSAARPTERARDWTRILTDGKGIFCTSQQEDNAIYEALKRGAGAKLLDLDRAAVLRAGSDFLSPYDGQSSGQPPELRRAGRLPDRARESLSRRESTGAAYRGQPADVATRRARALTH